MTGGQRAKAVLVRDPQGAVWSAVFSRMRPPACPELLRLEYSATTGRLRCWWLGPGDKALKLANWAVWLGGGAQLGSSAHVRADASNARALAASGLLGAEADEPGAQAGQLASRAM